jgi:hypothetical protein
MNMYAVLKPYTTTDVYHVEAKDEKEAVKLVDDPDYSRYHKSFDADITDSDIEVVQIYNNEGPWKPANYIKMRLCES